ncbi:hypothetical protein LEP1GSC203_2844 [Leptospira terpstrae serovar Hualin str. LT 11-33 = ATCC 700639]|uniref:Uncharacterized protein n=1 Tax=Leptospira terpstrae serovar Hualin str. LT 11-33 = ATCC 700639 TaxID=1257025 RepID=N1W2X5_9LEPT|nr:hypothetical protein LEP1GSC203_2844 [Leptospira terpstrae serovar Hualin str. LT 11-33 = ATCC 700639]
MGVSRSPGLPWPELPPAPIRGCFSTPDALGEKKSNSFGKFGTNDEFTKNQKIGIRTILQ